MLSLITKSLLAFVMVSTSYTTCKKDKEESQKLKNKVIGMWIGEYTVNNLDQNPLFYSLSIYPNGTILTKGELGNGEISYSEGTWDINNKTFEATITTFSTAKIEQKISGYVSQHSGLANVTWKDTRNPYASYSGNINRLYKVK